LAIFANHDWSKAQAAGLIANIEAESAFDPQAIGDGGAAFGICQWHSDRQDAFRRQFGFSIQDADYGKQLEFVAFELTKTEARAGNALRGADNAQDAGEIVCSLYERPNDPDGHVRRSRGARAGDWFSAL